MAVAFQSATSATTTSGSITITKPSSVAVGDLLIAVIGTQNSISTAPTGWTALTNKSTASGYINVYVYYVVATSTQVSATDFTWTASTNFMVGGISRITGQQGTPVGIYASANAASSTTPTLAMTVTPDDASSLLLFCVGSGINSGATNSSSAYAIVTSNPSWTEAFDTTANAGGSGSGQVAMAYATRPEITATGNASLTLASSWESAGIMVVVRPLLLYTASETETATDATVRSVTKTLSETENASDTISSSKQLSWSNDTKNTSTWTNDTKN